MKAQRALAVFWRLKKLVSRFRPGSRERRAAFYENEVIPEEELRHGKLIGGSELKVGDRLNADEVIVNIIYNETNDHRFVIYRKDGLYFKGFAEKIWITKHEDLYFKYWEFYSSEFSGGLFDDPGLVEENARREIDWLKNTTARSDV